MQLISMTYHSARRGHRTHQTSIWWIMPSGLSFSLMQCVIFKQCIIKVWNVMFSFSLGSVSTLIRWGGHFCHVCVKHFFLLTTVQQCMAGTAMEQSVNISSMKYRKHHCYWKWLMHKTKRIPHTWRFGEWRIKTRVIDKCIRHQEEIGNQRRN